MHILSCNSEYIVLITQYKILEIYKFYDKYILRLLELIMNFMQNEGTIKDIFFKSYDNNDQIYKNNN